MRLKVLIIANDFPTPAQPQLGVFILRQIQALQRLGHEFSVLRILPLAPPLGERWRYYRSVPAEYHYEGIGVRTGRALWPPRLIGLEYLRHQVSHRVNVELKRVAPDLIHAHYLLAAGTFAVGHGAPVVVTSHGSDAYDWPWRRPGLRSAAARVVRMATTVVAVSRFVAENTRRLYDRDIQVIMNGAEDAVFQPADRGQARIALGIEAMRPVVAFAGYFIPTKGIYDLSDALASLSELRPLLLLAGSGPEHDRLRRRLEGAGVDHRMCGVLDQQALAQVYAAADVVALPSHEEGLPAVVCEAMLAGRAVLATPVGGIPEIIQDGKTGVLVRLKDAASIADGLHRILSDPQFRIALETNARAFAVDRLTWRANAAAYDRIYKETVSARRGN